MQRPDRSDVRLAVGHDEPATGIVRIFDEPLARWIVFVGIGIAVVTVLLLAAGIWAKRRVVKL